MRDYRRLVITLSIAYPAEEPRTNLCTSSRFVTTPPKVREPSLACDCHAHVLGPADRYPYVADRSFTPPDALEDAYLRMLSTLGIECMVIVRGTDNSRVTAAVTALGPHRACGVAMVGPDVAAEALRELDAHGIRATRFITTAKGGPGLDSLPEVARKVAPYGWHIEMYVPPAVWPDLLPIIDRLPVPVMFDHMAALCAGVEPNDPVLLDILRKLESGRHWVKLCGDRASVAGYVCADVAPPASLFLRHAPERCVWGTDWPHTNIAEHMPDDGELLDLLTGWTSGPAVRQQILVDNPAMLYRLGR
ncbi:MAG: amidohydrolase family protein [Acetobacteraceae bacterium]